MQRIRMLLQPSSDWGPKLQVHRIEAGAPTHTDSQVPLTGQNNRKLFHHKALTKYSSVFTLVDDLELELATVLEHDCESENGIEMICSKN